MKLHLYIYLLTLILLQTSHAEILDSGSRHPHKRAQAPSRNQFTPRSVYLIFDIDTDKTRQAISLKTGQVLHAGHIQIRIDGSPTQGPLTMDIGGQNKVGLAVKAQDLGVANSGKPIKTHTFMTGYVRHIIRIGQTPLPNAWFLDFREGRGMIVDAWNENPVYVIGRGTPPNSCIEFVERVVWRMRLGLSPAAQALIDNMKEYYTSYSRKVVKRVQFAAAVQVRPAPPGVVVQEGFINMHSRVFNVDHVEDPKAPELVMDDTIYIPEDWVTAVRDVVV